jgi:Protein of unknown function (DUF1559)
MNVRTHTSLGYLAASILLLAPTLGCARDDTVDRCNYNLEHLCVALRAYRQVFGHYPPAAFLDTRGTPIQSWRRVILPFLDVKVDLTQFNVEMSWDSLANVRARKLELSIFQCPYCHTAKDNRSDFFYLREFCTEDSLVLIEVPNTTIEWAEPRDVTVTDLRRILTGNMSSAKHHPGGIAVMGSD